MYAQRAEAVVQVPYPEASVGDAFPLQEEAVDGGPGEWLDSWAGCWVMWHHGAVSGAWTPRGLWVCLSWRARSSDLLQIPAQRRLSEVLCRHQRASPAHGNGSVSGGCPSGCAGVGGAGCGGGRSRACQAVDPRALLVTTCLSVLSPPDPHLS